MPKPKNEGELKNRSFKLDSRPWTGRVVRLEAIDEARLEFPIVAGIALESSANEKDTIKMQITGFTPLERLRLLEAESVKRYQWFVKWFGDDEADCV